VPNFTVMAPKDEAELQRMLVTSIAHDGPCAIRIPRGEGEGVPLMDEGWQPLEIGRGELLTDGDDVLIVAYGSMVAPAMATAGTCKTQPGTSAFSHAWDRCSAAIPAPPISPAKNDSPPAKASKNFNVSMFNVLWGQWPVLKRRFRQSTGPSTETIHEI
jgi:hypothetical protein